MILNQDPVISLPVGRLEGQNGVFTLLLRKRKPLREEWAMIPFKARAVTSGRVSIERLSPKDEASVDVTCKEHYEKMRQLWAMDVPGFVQKVFRVRLLYRRALDGQPFSIDKC